MTGNGPAADESFGSRLLHAGIEVGYASNVRTLSVRVVVDDAQSGA